MNLTSREEELWRGDVLKCLYAAHTLGNFAEMSFGVVKSLYSVRRFAIHYSMLLAGLTDFHRSDWRISPLNYILKTLHSDGRPIAQVLGFPQRSFRDK